MAARSPVFEAMLYDFIERPLAKELIIHINDANITADVWMVLLRCIYSDRPRITHDTLLGATEAAKKYQVESLRDACVKFTKKGVSASDACLLFEKSPHLALNYIELHTDKVIKTDGFLSLSASRLIELLRSSKLDVKEVDLWNAVVAWAKRETNRQHLDVNSKNMRTVLKDIIPMIRFPTMSTEEISVHVAPLDLLDNTQLLQVFSYLGGNKSMKITFSTVTREANLVRWSFDGRRRGGSGLILTDEHTIAVNQRGISYVLGSRSFKKGKHAWRIRFISLSGQSYVAFGVSGNKQYYDQNTSYNDPTFYGWSSSNQSFLAGADQGTVHDMNILSDTECDILLDCDNHSLTAVRSSSGNRHTIVIPSTELVPHFHLHTKGNSISMRVIRVGDFGRSSSFS